MRQSENKEQTAPAYQCIEVVCQSGACAAARALEGCRILTEFAHLFPLPLPECDVFDCDCRYRHFRDRRQQDRRSPYSYSRSSERRFGGDRRQSPFRSRPGPVVQP